MIRILTEGKVSVAQQKRLSTGAMVLAKDDVLEVRVLPDPVSRRMIQRFSKKFHIPFHLFAN